MLIVYILYTCLCPLRDPKMADNWNISNKIFKKECLLIHNMSSLNDLVHSLARKSRLERRQMRETYLAIYGEDLINHHLQKTHLCNSNNEICNVLSLWMLEPHDRDAVIAKNAFEHGGINYKALVEIYSGRKSSHLLLIKQAYQSKFRRHLDQDIIESEPPHPYQRILVALTASHKSHHSDISQHVAKCDAKRLYETGEGKAGGSIEESAVLEIFSKRSIPQLRLTFSTYKHIYGHDYTKSLKKEIYGEFEDALRVVVKCMYTPPKYYAKTLHASIKGTTTDKSALTRVMISRAEVDMDEIKRVYKKKYGMELKDAISQSCSNGLELRDFLVIFANIALS